MLNLRKWKMKNSINRKTKFIGLIGLIGLGGALTWLYSLPKDGTLSQSRQTAKNAIIRILNRLRYHSIDPKYDKVILGQAWHETGGFTSRAFLEGNNCFGISPKGTLAKYQTIEDSVDRYIQLIQLRVFQDGNVNPPDSFIGYVEFLKRHKYFEDKVTTYVNGTINGWKQSAKLLGL